MREGGKNGVSVVVRVRNFDGSVPYTRCNRPLENIPHAFSEICAGEGDKNRFTFDAVLSSACDQQNVFRIVGRNVVTHALEGYNSCVLAYGQTSSGKTFSMIGPEGGSEESFSASTLQNLSESNVGLIPRILDELFARQQSNSEVTTKIEISCVELYNEIFFDLLRNDGEAVGDLKIREDRSAGGRGIFVEGARFVGLQNTTQLFEILRKVAINKHTSFTNMNATSSRSHTVFTVTVEQIDHVRHDSATTSRIFLVDLAGSERVEKTGAFGDRLREAQTINLSLTLLGNVIKKLTDDKSMHIPYRDSKLTRLLQDALGGNTLTTLLCAVSSDPTHASETLSTLAFAQRAKSIRNHPIVNKILAQEEYVKEIAILREEIRELSEKLRDMEGIMRLRNSGSTNDQEDINLTLESALRELHEVKDELRASRLQEVYWRDAAQYHREKESEQATKCGELAQKLEIEKVNTELAVKKLTDIIPSMAKATNGQLEDVKSRHTELTRRASVGIRSVNPPRKAEVETMSLKVQPAVAPLDAPSTVQVEAQAILRERMLLSQVEALQEELKASRKFSVMCDHLMREVDAIKVASERKLDEQDEKHATIVRGFDDRVADLTARLENQSSLASSATDVKEELKHLQMENRELHAENRANAVRLLDFTKRIDTLTKEVNSLQEDRVKLTTTLETATMDAKLKQQLLTLTQVNGTKDRSYFRKKLLECFSTD